MNKVFIIFEFSSIFGLFSIPYMINFYLLSFYPCSQEFHYSFKRTSFDCVDPVLCLFTFYWMNFAYHLFSPSILNWTHLHISFINIYPLFLNTNIFILICHYFSTWKQIYSHFRKELLSVPISEVNHVCYFGIFFFCTFFPFAWLEIVLYSI